MSDLDLRFTSQISIDVPAHISSPFAYRSHPASARVTSPADTARHPLTFCPAHSAENSPFPCVSAFARSGAIAALASGNGGASLIGPTPRITRFTIPLAGRPENTLER